MGRRKLTRDVLGREFSPFDRSIDTHVCNLRKRLAHCRTAANESKACAASAIFTCFPALSEIACKVSSSKSFCGSVRSSFWSASRSKRLSILANYYETSWQRVLHSIMPDGSRESPRACTKPNGKQAVQDYLDELQRQKSVRFYFFDEEGTRCLDRGAPAFDLKLAANKEGLERTARSKICPWLIRKTELLCDLVEGAQRPQIHARVSAVAHD